MSHKRRFVMSISRRQAGGVLAAAALLSIAFGPVLPATAAAAPSAWGQSDASGAASRSNLGEKVLSPATVTGLSHRRGVTVQAADPDACANGGIDVAASNGTVDYVEGNGHLNAYAALTGTRLWTVVPDSFFSTYFKSIAVVSGLVILGEVDCESQSDPNGLIQAFNATTGQLVWTQSPHSALDSLVVAGAYVVETGSSPGSGQFTSVLRVATGAVVWQTTGPDCYTFGSAAVVVVAQQVVTRQCDQNGNRSLAARALTTGKSTWTRAVSWTIQRADNAASGARHLLIEDNNGSVAALNPATGATQYYFHGATSVLAVDATRVYSHCGSGSVCAFSLTTAALLWSASNASTLAAEANGVLYLADGLMLNAATGASLARLYTTGTASILMVAGGRVHAVTTPQTLDLYGRTGS